MNWSNTKSAPSVLFLWCWESTHSHRHVTQSRKPFQKSGGFYRSKKGTKTILMPWHWDVEYYYGVQIFLAIHVWALLLYIFRWCHHFEFFFLSLVCYRYKKNCSLLNCLALVMDRGRILHVFTMFLEHSGDVALKNTMHVKSVNHKNVQM